MRTGATGLPAPSQFDDPDDYNDFDDFNDFNGAAARRGRRFSMGPLPGAGLSQRTLGFLGVLAVVVVLAVPVLFGLSHIPAGPSQGGSSQAAATRVPPAQAPGGFTSYVADAYSVAYPAAWTPAAKDVDTGQGTIRAQAFGDGKGTQAVMGVGAPVPATQLQLTIDNVAQRYFAPAVPGSAGSGGSQTYNGVTWIVGDYAVATGPLGSQTTYHLRVLAANVGAQTVVVVFQAQQGAFAGADSAQFEPMMQSFRFG